MSLEKVKLELLARSKTMLNAAQSDDWELLTRLNSDWREQLELAVTKYGSELDSIGGSLLEDNQKIYDCLEAAQRVLSLDLDKNIHSASSIKKYLK